ncbi:leucine-rich repeat protein [Butyrivibrio sp. WCD2001]|uniref:leucine-rich repeat protein n=1 Tax=Butyrivibrio sp. WCD2001 TaxID=1280681 RepID=UPI0003FD90FB|nr:leucine-rich repeat protein [Butyrivibrio sp. WCD2001]
MRGQKIFLKRVLSFALVSALCFALQPMSALANDTKDTFSDVPIMVGTDAGAVEQGKATIKLSSGMYSSQVTRYEYQIISHIGSTVDELGPEGRDVTIDSGYDVAQVFDIYIDGITSDALQPNDVRAAILTVPVPEGCTPIGAKRVLKWGKIGAAGEPNTEREDAVDNKNGTVSIQVALGVGMGQNTEVTICGASAIEFKKVKDISSLKDKAKVVQDKYDYTGSAITPDVSIEGLAKDVDYTVTYKNNVEPGTATATITGIGAYTGSFDLTFIIQKEYKNEDITDKKSQAEYDVNTTNDGTVVATLKKTTNKKAKKYTVPEEIELPDGSKAKVTQIGPKAFKDSNATQITIPKSISKISSKAFSGSSAKKIIIKTDKKPNVSIGKGAFKNMKAKNPTILIKGCKGKEKAKLVKKVEKQSSKGTKVK